MWRSALLLLCTLFCTLRAQPLYGGIYVSEPSVSFAADAPGGPYTLDILTFSVDDYDYTMNLSMSSPSVQGSVQVLIAGQASCQYPGPQLVLSLGGQPSCKQSGTVTDVCSYLVDVCTGVYNYSLATVSTTTDAPPDGKYLSITGLCGINTVSHHLYAESTIATNLTCAQPSVTTYSGTFTFTPSTVAVYPVVVPTGTPWTYNNVELDINESLFTLNITVKDANSARLATVILTGSVGCSSGGQISVALGDHPWDCRQTATEGFANLCQFFTEQCSQTTFGYNTYQDADGDYQLVIGGDFCSIPGPVRLTTDDADGNPDCAALSKPLSTEQIVPGPGTGTETNPDGTVTIINEGVIDLNAGRGINADCVDGNCTITNTGVIQLQNIHNMFFNCSLGVCAVASYPGKYTSAGMGGNCGGLYYDSDSQHLEFRFLGIYAPGSIDFSFAEFVADFTSFTPGDCGYGPLDVVTRIVVESEFAPLDRARVCQAQLWDAPGYYITACNLITSTVFGQVFATFRPPGGAMPLSTAFEREWQFTMSVPAYEQ